MKPFLIRWLATTLAVALAVQLTGMHADGPASLFFMALILGVINAIVRPLLLILSIPFIVLSLGFFILVLNALLFEVAGSLVPGFIVGGFWNAFFGSIIVSVVNWAFSAFTRTGDGRFQVSVRRKPSLAPAGEKPIHGRVID